MAQKKRTSKVLDWKAQLGEQVEFLRPLVQELVQEILEAAAVETNRGAIARLGPWCLFQRKPIERQPVAGKSEMTQAAACRRSQQALADASKRRPGRPSERARGDCATWSLAPLPHTGGCRPIISPENATGDCVPWPLLPVAVLQDADR